MPEEKKSNTNPPENADAHNKEIAEKQAAQDISGKSTSAVENKSTSDALDGLLKEAEKKKAEGRVPVEPKLGEAPPPKPSDVPPKSGESPPPPKPSDAPIPPKPAAEIKKDEEAAKRAEELFKDSPALPTGASPKSSEAFSAVKIRAAQEISKLEQKVQELTKVQFELSEKVKNPIPAEITKELEELRQFRARLDVDLDPKFKEYDKLISSAQEFIYAQLKKSPAITDDVIAQIKKYGGPENVNLEKIFEAIKDPLIQRLVEAKVADVEQQKFNKEQAIKATKENISQYLTERQKTFQEAATSHNSVTKTELDKLVAGLPWFKEQTPPAGADETVVKSAQEHNAFVATTRKQLDEALSDDSPEMRAIMLVGMAQLFNLQKVHGATKAENDALKKQLEESNSLIERLKSSSRSRLPESAAPSGKVEPVKPKDDFSTNAGVALDRLRDQVIEARAKAESGA